MFDETYDFHTTSMDVAIGEVFPGARMIKLTRNKDSVHPPRVSWSQVREKSPEELGETAEVAAISDPSGF